MCRFITTFIPKTGQFELGFSQAEAERLDRTRIIPLRVLPGEDASCLNLYRPESPRILGVPESLTPARRLCLSADP